MGHAVHGRVSAHGRWATTTWKASSLLVAEFKHKVQVTSCDVPVPKVITDQVQPPFQGIPLHAKLVSSRSETVANGENGEKQVQISKFGI